jgi:RNA polymerase sigma-B factor
VAEIAEAVDATDEQVLEALEAAGAYRAASLDTPRGSKEEEPGETLAESFGMDEEGFDLAEHRATLEPLLECISPREQRVLRLRFQEDLTQAEIGRRIGVSQMQVSRLIRQALARLRSAAQDSPPPE